MAGVDVNYLAVLAGGIVSMILGALWYGPLFSKQWIALSGITLEKMEEGKKKMVTGYLITFIGALLMTYLFSHILAFAQSYMDKEGLMSGLSTGFWIWIGFVAPVTLGSTLWEGKPWKLYFLNNGYNLIQLLLIGMILAIWK